MTNARGVPVTRSKEDGQFPGTWSVSKCLRRQLGSMEIADDGQLTKKQTERAQGCRNHLTIDTEEEEDTGGILPVAVPIVA